MFLVVLSLILIAFCMVSVRVFYTAGWHSKTVFFVFLTGIIKVCMQ